MHIRTYLDLDLAAVRKEPNAMDMDGETAALKASREGSVRWIPRAEAPTSAVAMPSPSLPRLVWDIG